MTAKTELEKQNLATYQSWKPQKATTQLGVWRGKTLMTLPEKASYFKHFTWWLFQKVGFLSTDHYTVSTLKRSVKQFVPKTAATTSLGASPASESLTEAPLSPLPASIIASSLMGVPSPAPASTSLSIDSPPPASPSAAAILSPSAAICSPSPSPSEPSLTESQKRLPRVSQGIIRLERNINTNRNIALKINTEDKEHNAKNEAHRITLDELLKRIKEAKSREDVDALQVTIKTLPRTFHTPLTDLGMLYVEANKETK